MKSLWRKPDLVLALVVVEVYAPAILPNTYFAPLQSLYWPFLYRPLAVLLAYFVYRSIRSRAPLTGMLIGFASVTLVLLPEFALNLSRSDLAPHGAELWQVLPVVLVPTGIGGVLGTASWLISGRRSPPSVVHQCEKPEGVMLAACVVLALALLFDATAWAVQSGRGFVELLLVNIGTGPWFTFLTLDRLVVVALAAGATYALLKRKRYARVAVLIYLAVGLLFSLARVPVFRQLSGLGSWTPCEGGIGPPVGSSVMYLAVYVEAPLRAIACAVGIPYVLRSKKLREFLQPTRAEA